MFRALLLTLLALPAFAAPQLVVTQCDDVSVPEGCVAVDLVGEGEFASTAFNLSLPTKFISLEKGADIDQMLMMHVVRDGFVRVVIYPPFQIPIVTFEAGEMVVLCMEPGEFTCESVGFYDRQDGSYTTEYDVGNANGQNIPMERPPIIDGAAFQPDDPSRTAACGLGFELVLLLPILMFKRR